MSVKAVLHLVAAVAPEAKKVQQPRLTTLGPRYTWTDGTCVLKTGLGRN